MFPQPDDDAVWVVTSDASGVDGVRGYAFCGRGDSRTAYLVSEYWPEETLQALRRGAATAGARATEREGAEGRELPVLSMPAAELFGSWATAEAVRTAAGGGTPQAIVAVGDCVPAAAALNAASSGATSMREVLRAARRLTAQWLAVSVPREANVDADRLSHPRLFDTVAAEARSAGLAVQRARIPESCWRTLRDAARTGGQEVAEREAQGR
eukprot:2115889-Pleurochrysis_carterae.AAC.3